MKKGIIIAVIAIVLVLLVVIVVSIVGWVQDRDAALHDQMVEDFWESDDGKEIAAAKDHLADMEEKIDKDLEAARDLQEKLNDLQSQYENIIGAYD